MRLLAYYIVFVLVGMVMAYLIGRAVEQWSAGASLPVFLPFSFFVFWHALRLSVLVPYLFAGGSLSSLISEPAPHLAGFPISRRGNVSRNMEERHD